MCTKLDGTTISEVLYGINPHAYDKNPEYIRKKAMISEEKQSPIPVQPGLLGSMPTHGIHVMTGKIYFSNR